MKLGTVIGNVWATKKDDSLSGFKLMIVALLPPENASPKNGVSEEIVAIDTIGAGIGDIVLIAGGSSARYLYGKSNSVPIDAAIVGIVDEMERVKTQ